MGIEKKLKWGSFEGLCFTHTDAVSKFQGLIQRNSIGNPVSHTMSASWPDQLE